MNPTTDPGDAPLPRSGKPSVLLVEDNALVARALHAVLEDAGVDVRCLADGESAWELLQSNASRSLGAVVCDLGLPGISGRELLQRIVNVKPGLPVIIISGYNEAPLVDELLHAGARAVVGKPVNPEDFVAIVSSHLPSA